ncbi:MAG: hypothetical protein JJT96_12570 [Opitutales bacterium]|nr:hypothetical protein [Opitutales bacterium]
MKTGVKLCCWSSGYAPCAVADKPGPTRVCEIETFFKWLKCITGTRPNKRQMEAIQLDLMGWMTEDEPAAALSQQKTKKY